MRERTWLGGVILIVGLALGTSVGLSTIGPSKVARADDPPSAAGPLLKLLKSGRLPKERQGTVVEMVCKRGNEHDLAVVLEQVLKPDAYAPPLRRQVLDLFIDANQTRKVKPTGDLAAIATLLAEPAAAKDAGLQLAVVKLIGLWNVTGARDELVTLAKNAQASLPVRQAAIDAVNTLGGKDTQAIIGALAGADQPPAVRFLAIASLARTDTAAAAKLVAPALAAAKPSDDPSAMLDAFLHRKQGADQLAKELAGQPISADVAKLCLRHMYAVGRSDPSLSEVLGKLAGVQADPPPPTAEEVAKLVTELQARGDAARGEKIFRRADLSCMKCHSLTRAGGTVGPELSAVGSISPPDYIVNSILVPNLAIKEQYVTRIVETANGETFTGVVVDRDSERLNLRDATGKVITIPVADIEEEAEGKSLMPQGITRFLTHGELLDLARFVSELGKPGPYAIPTVPTLQRWRVLREPAAELLSDVPNVEQLRQYVLAMPPDAWGAAYAKVAGTLPLDELLKPTNPRVLYLQAEVDVSQAGQVQLNVHSTEPVQTWIDAEPFEAQQQITTELSAERHKLTFRVAVGNNTQPELRVEVRKPSGSSIQFDVVGGP